MIHASRSKGVSVRTGRSSTSTAPRTLLIARNSGKEDGGGLINEDVLARLQKAEEEATRLRAELAASRVVVNSEALTGKKSRVDSVDKREGLFSGTDSVRVDPEAEATIQRRLLLGGLGSVVLAALSMIPDSTLQFKPDKPMYFFLVPLLRSKGLLEDCSGLIEEAEWQRLRQVLARISGNPNNVRSNLDSVIALIDNSRTRDQAKTLASEFVEYLDAMDYQKYFDAIPSRQAIAPDQNMKFVAFSGKACKAALEKLNGFLGLVPSDAIADAKSQMAI
eukprot:gene24700-10335_t